MKYSKETIASIMADTAMEAAKASASFNYEAVQSVMESTGCTWHISDSGESAGCTWDIRDSRKNVHAVPNVRQIKKMLMELLDTCIYQLMAAIMDDDHEFSKEDDAIYSASSGGLKVDIIFFPFAEEECIENSNDSSKNSKNEWVLVKYKYEICNDLMYFE